MKLSFSIPKSTSKSKPLPPSSQVDSSARDSEKQFVTEFDPSKALSHNSKPKYVIPPKENEWRPHKKMKNLELLPTLQSDPDGPQFEISTALDGSDDKNIPYGLSIRQQSSTVADAEDGVSKAERKVEKTENMLLEKLKYDLQRLPEDRGFEEFKDVPVEGFGAALLAGYGWEEGRGIGRNAKEDVKVKEYKKRSAKEGLGFFSNDINGSVKDKDRNGSVKDREDRERYKESKRERDWDVSVNGNGNGDGKDGFFVGKDVRVISGGSNILGLKGRIKKRINDDWIVLRVEENKEDLKVSVSDIADLGSKEEEKCLRKLKALQIETKPKKNRDSDKGVGRESVRRVNVQVKDDRQRWLRNHIRVRIISKDLKGGRFFLKKGEVVDVVGPYVCDISMDETKELVQGVDQDLLETALPRRGGPVLVLYGKYRGMYGTLVKRDLDEEMGVVQDADTHELLNVKLEQIAEYVGDPSYIGY